MDATAHTDTKHLNPEVVDVSGEIQLARQSKNQEFHEIFPTIPPNVSLVEDYNCSWIVDIPIQGKLYLSTEFICFVSNAFSGKVRKVIPLDDLEEIQKETNIELFPNGIGVKTKNSWYFFTTFYSRDETFNLIYRLNFDFKTKLDRDVAQVDHFALELNAVDDSYYGIPFSGPRIHPPTDINYVEQEGDNFICDAIIQAPMGVVYELLFGNDTRHIIKILKDQKNYNITEASIVGLSDVEKYRAYSYTKPLNNVVGPKKTTCNIQESLHINDPESMVLVEQITRTPDVPNGNAFLLKTRIYLSWGDYNSTRLFVVTNIEWSSKSWLKGPIEIERINGQKKFMKDIIVSCDDIFDGYKSGVLRTEKLDDSPEKKVDSEELSAVDGSYYGIPFSGPRIHPPTDINYVEQEGDNFICDETIQAPMGVVYELLFGNDTRHIIKILKDQENYNITEASIVGISDDEKSRVSRVYSYVKFQNDVGGAKKPRYNIQETLQINDLESMVLVEQITRTPDVPNGNAFLLKTRIYLSWGDYNSTRFFVITNFEWSSRSWIKWAVEFDRVNYQKKFMENLIVSCGEILDGYKSRLLRTEKLDDSPEKKENSEELSAVDGSYYGIPFSGPRIHPPTDINYVEQEGDNFICDKTIQAPMGVVYELLFGNDTRHIIKILKDQENYNITEASIVGISDDEKSRVSRVYSYVKFQNDVGGAKKPRYNIQETLQINDLESMVLVEQITRMPDSLSGNAFLLKTRIYLSWGDYNSTRFFVVANFEWSSRSWMKWAVEFGGVNYQKTFMENLIVSCGEILDGYKSRSLRA